VFDDLFCAMRVCQIVHVNYVDENERVNLLYRYHLCIIVCLIIKRKRIVWIIRYRFTAERSFDSVKIDGMSRSHEKFRCLITVKSLRLRTHKSKDDYDFFISNVNIHEGLFNIHLFFYSFLFFDLLQHKDNSHIIRNPTVLPPTTASLVVEKIAITL
jgi:hypothetical protein